MAALHSKPQSRNPSALQHRDLYEDALMLWHWQAGRARGRHPTQGSGLNSTQHQPLDPKRCSALQATARSLPVVAWWPRTQHSMTSGSGFWILTELYWCPRGGKAQFGGRQCKPPFIICQLQHGSPASCPECSLKVNSKLVLMWGPKDGKAQFGMQLFGSSRL